MTCLKSIRLSTLTISLCLLACTSPNPRNALPMREGGKTAKPNAQDPETHQKLQNLLGMQRAPADLGFSEKRFDPCRMGLNTANGCGESYFTVVHFQLLCRDSEGSISYLPSLTPIVANYLEWNLGGLSGDTHTDEQGYGQFTVLAAKSARQQRLTLKIGPQFVGFTASEVTKVVLPKNFCRSDRA